MEMNKQEWNDILNSEIDGKGMINDVFSRGKEDDDEEIIVKEIDASIYTLKKDEQRRDDSLFQESIVFIFGKYLDEMKTNDMDYCDLQNVVNLIKNRQWKKIPWYVEKVNETYFSELIQTLLTRTKQHLYQRMLKDVIAEKISLLDAWDEFHNLSEEPLRKVFKLPEDDKFDKVDTYIDGVNFFRDEVEDHKRTAKLRWKRILTHHPLNSTWLCNVKEKEPWPQLPQVDRKTPCPPNE